MIGNRILAATDGKPESVGALRLARALAERDGGTVEVLAVVEPFLLYSSGDPGSGLELEMERHQADVLRAEVRARLREVGGAAPGWPVRVEMGSPAPMIARYAAINGASVVVLGIGRHGRMDRWLGSETALRVMHVAHVPVLAAQPGAAELPRRALVATDFSGFSADAARSAAELLGEGGEVHLVHAVPPAGDGPAEWMRTYLAGARVRLDEAARSLEEEGGVRVSTHLVEGDPVRMVLALAERLGVELLAAGTHGYGFVGRVLMGSVSTRLVRGAHCSVLVTPPRSVTAELDRMQGELQAAS